MSTPAPETAVVEHNALIEAMARLEALSLRCDQLSQVTYSLNSEALAIRAELRRVAFGEPPEADDAFETDPVSVAIEARVAELTDEPDRAERVRQLGDINAA